MEFIARSKKPPAAKLKLATFTRAARTSSSAFISLGKQAVRKACTGAARERHVQEAGFFAASILLRESTI